jgi:hypothetical protein
MKTYVEEEDENQEISNQLQEEIFEDIDSTEENDRDDQNDQFVYNLNINSLEICKKCDVKRKTFKSNNVFHSHIRDCKDDETTINIFSEQKFENVSIVKFFVKNTIKKNYDFRFYQYVIVWMQIFLKKSSIKEVADTNCAMSLMNWKYLTTILFKVNIQNMFAFINVRDIENILHQFSSYVILNLYLLDIIDDKKVKDHIHREFHIVDELKCKTLMRLNIMTSEEMTINLANKFLVILICENLVIFIRINLKSNSRIRRIIHSKKSVKISSNSIVSIFIYLRDKKLSFNRDFLFELNNDILTKSLNDLDEFYTHVCDCNLAFVHVRNALISSVMISSKTRLKILIEYEKEECFQMKLELHEWVVVFNEKEVERDFS